MSIHKRTTKSGQTRYDVRLRKPDGTPYSTTFRTKREAERFESKQLSDRDQGTWIDPHAGKITFREWANEWHATMVHSWRPSTSARHRSALDEHWIPVLGSMRLSSISPRTIQNIVNDLAARLQPSTIRSYYGTLRSTFSDAVETDVIGRSPCRGVRLPSPSRSEKRIISPLELHRLADVIGPPWRSLVYLGGVMGLRFGEAVGLNIEDADLITGRVKIVRTVSEVRGRLTVGPPKTAASLRTLTVPTPLLDELRGHVSRLGTSAPTSPLFRDDDGGLVRRSNFRARIWTPAVEAANLEDLTFHGLRHSAATAWIAQGIDARTVQFLLGHSDPRLVLRLYAHAEDKAIQQAAVKVATGFWPSLG